jgi:hypothetical protein
MGGLLQGKGGALQHILAPDNLERNAPQKELFWYQKRFEPITVFSVVVTCSTS